MRLYVMAASMALILACVFAGPPAGVTSQAAFAASSSADNGQMPLVGDWNERWYFSPDGSQLRRRHAPVNCTKASTVGKQIQCLQGAIDELRQENERLDDLVKGILDASKPKVRPLTSIPERHR